MVFNSGAWGGLGCFPSGFNPHPCAPSAVLGGQACALRFAHQAEAFHGSVKHKRDRLQEKKGLLSLLQGLQACLCCGIWVGEGAHPASALLNLLLPPHPWPMATVIKPLFWDLLIKYRYFAPKHEPGGCFATVINGTSGFCKLNKPGGHLT